MADESVEEVGGTRHVTYGPIGIDVGHVGDARIKRMVYPPGMRWSTDVRPLVHTDRCEHAHAGFLVEGSLHFEYDDGCVVEYAAPAVVEVAPGHDAWVVGDEPVVVVDWSGATNYGQ